MSVKSLLLGTVAGIFALSTARGADVPFKARATSDYVRVCSLYGLGFYYIPGTDTCVRIGGYVRADFNYNALGGGTPSITGPNGRRTRTDESPYATRHRAVISVDARAQSAYGTVRSYLEMGFSNENQQGSSSPSAFFSRAFVQWAGFTFGRIQSPTEIFGIQAYQYGTSAIGTDSYANGVNAANYTAEFGGGLSALLGIEERGGGRAKSVINLSDPGALAAGVTPANNAAGERFPDIETVLRLDQAWGRIGGFLALHDASGGYYGSGSVATVTTTAGHPGDKLGWAAGFGGQFNLPTLGQGDTIGAQFVYSQGAAGYAAYAHNGAGLYGSGNNLALGFLSDATFATNTGAELTTAWSITTGLEHNWTPALQTSVYGAYLKVDYNPTATSFFCVTGTTAAVQSAFNSLSNCNPDYSLWYVGSRTQWKPVKDLSLGIDVMYTHINSGFEGTASLAANGARPAGIYSLGDQGIVSVTARAQKNF